MPHLVYVMPFLFDANVISVGRNEKVVVRGNYRGTLETGGAITVVITHVQFLLFAGFRRRREVKFAKLGAQRVLAKLLKVSRQVIRLLPQSHPCTQSGAVAH